MDQEKKLSEAGAEEICRHDQQNQEDWWFRHDQVKVEKEWEVLGVLEKEQDLFNTRVVSFKGELEEYKFFCCLMCALSMHVIFVVMVSPALSLSLGVSTC